MKQFDKKIHFFVDPVAGDDAGRGSKQTPVKTLAKAFSLLDAKVRRSAEETAYTIHLLPGTHLLTGPITFDGTTVKALDYSLTLAGEKGAVITSAFPIPGSAFQKAEGKPYYFYDMPADKDPAFRDILCNGHLVPLVVSGDERKMPLSIPNDKDRSAPENQEAKLYVHPESVAGVNPDDPAPLELWIKVEWQLHAVRVVKIDLSDTVTAEDGATLCAVHIHPEDWEPFVKGFYATLRGRYYWFKNQLAYLHQENAFFYDKKIKRLYFFPAADVDMATAVIACPVSENLICLKDARNIAITGISFTGTTSNYITDNGYIAGQGGRIKKNGIGFLTHSAIQGTNVTDLYIARCDFTELGGDGVNTIGATDGCTVEKCRFENIAMSAIRIGSCRGKWNNLNNLNSNIRLVNNYIRHPGVSYKSNAGIVVGPVRNLCLCYNTLLDCPYSAISIGWSWSKAEFAIGESVNILNAEIAYNRVENFMYCMKDGGAIYTLGGNCHIDDHNYYNFMHDNYCVAGPTAGQNTGGYTILYHDGSSSNWLTSRNVIVVNPEAPSRFSYISFQSIPGQQVSNMMACDNYIVNLDDPFYVLGTISNDKARQKDFFLQQKNNKVGLRMDTLDKKARSIVENAGAEGYKVKL